jgi:RNA polymerase sigma-70 factor (ECF subfamily)
MGAEFAPMYWVAKGGGPMIGTDVVTAAYERHYAPLVRFVAARTRDPEVAADIVQEAFLRLIRENVQGRPPEQLHAWLYQVSLNLVISRARRVAVADRWEPWLRGAATGTEDSPERAVLSTERAAIVRRAVASLPSDQRAALLLAANGYAGWEIARAIGRSEGATRTLMCRARSRLRTTLQTTGAL